MKNVFCSVFFLVFSLNVVFGQTMPFYKRIDNSSVNKIIGKSDDRSSILKVNPLRLAVGDLNLSYERMLSQSMSVNVRMQYHPLGMIERGFGDWNSVGDDFTFALTEKPGFYFGGIDVEYRFYVKNKKVAQGFYVAPYVRYLRFGARFNPVYNSTRIGFTDDLHFSMQTSFNNVGGGFQAGMQWIISDRISIDWGFVGVGADFLIVDAKFQTDRLPDAMGQLSVDLQRVISSESPLLYKFGMFGLTNVERSFWVMQLVPGLKSSLTIGYKF